MSNASNLQPVKIVAAFSLSILAFLILIPIVNTINIPLESNNAGIVSLANTTNLSPYTNYIRFFILLLVPTLVAVAALKANQKLINRYWLRFTSLISKIITFLSNTKLYAIFILILILTWVINKNYYNLDFPLTDAFHEGEYLGFLPNFLSLEKPFLSSFMVHGFGIDVLTSLIANQLTYSSNTIALTRFFRMTEGAIGYFGCYWIIWEIVCSIKFNSNQKLSVFLFSSLLFTVFDGFFFDFFITVFAGRDTFFILQLALTIRFFRLASIYKLNKIENLIVPIIIGASIPISILYVYDRAAYFIFVYLFVCGLSLCFGQKFFINLLIKSTLGIAIASIPIIIWLGVEQVSEVLSQILFWIRYGRYISFNSFPSLGFDSFVPWFRFSLAILIQVFGIIYLVSTYKKGLGFGTFLKSKCLFIILWFASLVYMRILLDRPNYAMYAGSAALISMLLLIYILLSFYQAFFEKHVSQLITQPFVKSLTLIFVTLLLLLHPVLNPLIALDRIRNIYSTSQVPDVEIVREDFLQAYNAIKPEVAQSSCFFTLNQQGLWYYLFNKPSCTKFSIIFYARTTDAQETLIREVDTQKPKIILFSSKFTNNVDGIPISDGVPIIYRYFLNHYQPYTLLEESHWFWKRSEQKLTFVQDNSSITYGSINTFINERISKGDRVSLSGTAILPKKNRNADAVYVSYGVDNQLVEVTQVGENSNWKVSIPTLSLPIGKNILRVWSYDTQSNQLEQIGEDIKIDLTAN